MLVRIGQSGTGLCTLSVQEPRDWYESLLTIYLVFGGILQLKNNNPECQKPSDFLKENDMMLVLWSRELLCDP